MPESAQQPSFHSADAESALKGALALKSWWASVENGSTPVDFFELVAEYPGASAARGFFAEVQINGEQVPVMGHTGDYFFDRTQGTSDEIAENAGAMVDQAREFALGYWLRVQAWAQPQPYPELGRLQPPVLLRGLSMAPPLDPELSGMANLLRHYKLRETGEVGWFPRESAQAIIDVRELQDKYEWITIARSLLNFDLSLSFGPDQSLSLSAPLNTVMHLVLSSGLTVNELAPGPGTLGVFGTGCAFMAQTGTAPVAFGPDRLSPGLQLAVLRVLESGEIRLQTVTIMARPTKILSLSLDPNDWVVQAADRVSFGTASHLIKPVLEAFNKVSETSWGFDPASGTRKFLNRLMGSAGPETIPEQEHFERQILLKQAVESRTALLGTRLTWMQIPDWTDKAVIPAWVQNGSIV